MVKKLFSRGDVIMTNPQQGFYGIAIVLNDAVPMELEPGRFSYPMNHIAITPLLFTRPVTMDDLLEENLKPLLYTQYFLKDGKRYFWREKLCIDIYTYRNKAKFPIIGTVDVSEIYKEPLLWHPMEDRFHLCGDVDFHLGNEAYVQYCRDNNLEL